MGATVAIIAAQAARAEREFLEHFRGAGATVPERAVALPEVDRRIGRRRLERWMRDGVVRAGPGGYWLDEAAYAVHQREHAKAGVAVLALMLLVLLIVGLVVFLGQRAGPAQ